MVSPPIPDPNRRSARIWIPVTLVFLTFSGGLIALWKGTGIGKTAIPWQAIVFLFLMIATPALSLIFAIGGRTKHMLAVLGVGGCGLVGMIAWYFAILVKH